MLPEIRHSPLGRRESEPLKERRTLLSHDQPYQAVTLSRGVRKSVTRKSWREGQVKKKTGGIEIELRELTRFKLRCSLLRRHKNRKEVKPRRRKEKNSNTGNLSLD